MYKTKSPFILGKDSLIPEEFTKHRYFSGALFASLAVLFLIRFYFATQLMPAPVGDSMFFLEPIYNYCHSDKLIAYVQPIHPAGDYRYISHGPFTPILYRYLGKECDLQHLFELRTACFLIIPLALLVLVRRKIISAGAWFCLSVFCLAVSEKVGFRPEHICIILVVLAFVARVFDRIVLEGICCGCIFLSSPVSGGLYCVVRSLNSESANLKDIPFFLIGALGAVVIVFLLYPYSFGDWLTGIRVQAQFNVNRSDGDIFTYYIRSDFLPLWGLSIILMIGVASVRNLKYLLLLPFIWYFGLRVPTTSYNLLTTLVLVFLQDYPVMSHRQRVLTSALLLLPGLLGLAQLSARDAVSMALYPDSFDQSRSIIAQSIAEGHSIVGLPGSAIFTNPELHAALTAQVPPRSESDRGLSDKILIIGDNGSGGKSCPEGTTLINPQPKKPWWFLFKSSSSWAVNLCRYSSALSR